MNGQTLSKAFIALPGGATAVYNSSGLAYYRHSDWLGSSRLASTPARSLYYDGAYAPFGESYAGTGTIDHSFTGENEDTATGLDDFMFREYSGQQQGRWMSPDPLGVWAVNMTNPQSWNRYAYVVGNPLTSIDFWGWCTEGVYSACVNGNGPVVPTYSSPLGALITGAGESGPGGWQPGKRVNQQVDGILNASGTLSVPKPPKPKSAARQQCEQNAQQKYNSAKNQAVDSAVVGFAVGVEVTAALSATAGCLAGAGVGGFLGGAATAFLGAEAPGAGVGCGTGAILGFGSQVPTAGITGTLAAGITFAASMNDAEATLEKDLQACNQIP